MAGFWPWCCCAEEGQVYVVSGNQAPDNATLFVVSKSTGVNANAIVVGTNALGVAVNSDGDIYVGASGFSPNPSVRVRRYDGDLTQVDETTATLNSPSIGGLAVDDSGNVAFCASNFGYLFDSNLDLVWSQDWSSVSGAGPNDVAINLSGVVHFSGTTGGDSGTYTVRAWNASGTNTLNITKEETNATARSIYIDDSGDIFLALTESAGTNFWIRARKYNSSGTLQWTNTKTGTGTNFDNCRLAVAASGNIYLAGRYLNGTVFDGFLRKIDSSGSTVDEITFSQSGNSDVVAICVDDNEDIFLARANGTTTTSYGVYKYNSSLVEQWGGGSFATSPWDIDCDPGRLPHFQ